ncbi:hypothetical protein Goari_014011, partial [Gossypium aridum]|nr:hypothetical protein [Gossypium aridum]
AYPSLTWRSIWNARSILEWVEESEIEETLRGFFLEEQASEIGSIPLGNALQLDIRLQKAIWHNKNIYFHKGIRQRTCEIMAYIKADLADLDKLKEALKCQHNTVITHWEPPSKSQVKVNFDSAFLQQSNKAVSGIITKNYTGLVIGLCSYLIHSVRDLTIVEAYTCLEGAVFAEEIE